MSGRASQFFAAGLVAAALASPAMAACVGDNAGLSLPPGFCATIFADKIGHARHLVVAPNDVVYVNTWSGRYYGNDTPPPGGFLVALQDKKGSGKADVIVRFGPTAAQGSKGGTGVALYKDWLYFEVKDRIERLRLASSGVPPEGPSEVVVSGLPLTGDHPMHPFAIDAQGALYVDLGSATNSCQAENRVADQPGHDPCVELETRAGVWRYDANTVGQKFSPGERFATGLRNGEGFAFDRAGRVFATQHGRDQLAENWSKLYTHAQGAELPAEELVQIEQGDDFGWPYCYFDGEQDKLVLAPEYGGDGGQKIGVCAAKKPPVAAFPGHWAPNAMALYDGGLFPDSYRGGLFIAFHGSWNRAPSPQGGYNVVFQPLVDGKAAGEFIVFADGFAGANKTPAGAAHRPSGVAVGPDGALYISDDKNGRVWRVTYSGDRTAALQAAPAAGDTASSSSPVLPPEGIHPDAGVMAPPGVKPETVALGGRIFRGEEDGGPCIGCHGADARGGPLGGDLTGGKWLWANGSLSSIKQVIESGVPHPKAHAGAMPPKGGAALSEADVDALAAYVWSISRKKVAGK